MTKKRFNAIWEQCERNFNWEHVHSTMDRLHWVWATSRGRVPPIDQLKDGAKKLMHQVAFTAGEQMVVASSGGFHATRFSDEVGHEYIRLGFVFENGTTSQGQILGETEHEYLHSGKRSNDGHT